MYGTQFGPFQYDEFAHMTVQLLVTPIIVWLVQHALERWGHNLPLPLTAFFAGSIVFSLSAFYEIIELWDELYFHPHRIWGALDTATDLQFDLCGIVMGTLLACVLLKTKQTTTKSGLIEVPRLSGTCCGFAAFRGKPPAFRQARNSFAATPPEAKPLTIRRPIGKPEAFHARKDGEAANQIHCHDGPTSFQEDRSIGFTPTTRLR